MNKSVISTSKAPAAIGPYSQGLRVGELIFLSGQLGLDPVSGQLAQGVSAQTEQALCNIAAILASQGLGMEQVVKTTVFLADMGDFATVNEIYARHFSGAFPARSAVQVAALPKGGLVEIECICCADRQAAP